MYLAILLLGLAATVLFLAGFGVGLKNAIAEYRRGKPEPDTVPDYQYGSLAAFSVVCSAVVIALAGVSPVFIYIGPLLAIVTAVGCGVAFFVEDTA